MLKGSAAFVGFSALAVACGSDEDEATGDTADSGDGGGDVEPATGEVSIGSNYSNVKPQAGLAAAVAAFPNSDVSPQVNEVDHNTFQENISTYLQQPDDVIPWFAGFRMRFFADQDLLGDVTDVWDRGLNDQFTSGFKTASTGNDGNQYFVPWTYAVWGIHYRKSLFEENGWEVPTNLDELTTLAGEMEASGLVPFAFGNDGRWPAMGTFDQLNFRLNGFQFHVDLMAGQESWEDERVRDVFATYETLLALHQENPNGRPWEEAANAVVNREAGMMTIGSFIGGQFEGDDINDLDFFVFPELNPEHGTGVVEAPIDGWMLAKDPSNEAAAKEVLFHFGSTGGIDAYLSEDDSFVAANSNANVEGYNELQAKTVEIVGAAENITQFLDRDTSPEFASNVAGPGIADFLADPSQIDSILASMQERAEVIFS